MLTTSMLVLVGFPKNITARGYCVGVDSCVGALNCSVGQSDEQC